MRPRANNNGVLGATLLAALLAAGGCAAPPAAGPLAGPAPAQAPPPAPPVAVDPPPGPDLPSEGTPPGGAPPAPIEVPADEAPASPPPDSAAAPPPPRPAKKLANTLRWSTASEVDNFGFDVYRGESEEGPFSLVTENPIAGAGTTDVPQRYKFVDHTIEAGKAYWYYVESIALDGTREQFTPVIRVAPKGVPAGDEQGEP